MNKETIKKIGSLFAACAVLASSLSITAFAENETETESNLEYLLQDDFSNYTFVNTEGGANDGLSNWRIEYNDNKPCSDFISVEDKGTMTGALKIAGGATKEIRAGRYFKDKTVIGAGETFITEFDIYVESGADVSVGPAAITRSTVEDGAGPNFLRTQNYDGASEETIYYGKTQNLDAGRTEYSDIVFKRNEVNHIKVEYTLNKDLSTDSGDKMKFTITNSANEGKPQTQTVTTYWRKSSHQYGATVIGVNGLAFDRYTNGGKATTGDVWLDNVKVYREVTDPTTHYWLNEDFSNVTFVTANDSAKLRDWRVENNSNQNTNPTYALVEDCVINENTLLTDTLHLKDTSEWTAAEKRQRGGIGWDGAIASGTTFTVELDLVATDDADIALCLADKSAVTEQAGNTMLFRTANGDANSASNRIWYGSTQNLYTGSGNTWKVNGTSGTQALEFKRNEVNHIKVVYEINSDTSEEKTDIAQLFLTNSANEGKVQTGARIQLNRRATGNGVMLQNGVAGICFYKNTAAGEVYIDNLKVYRTNVTRPTVVSSDVTAAAEGSSNITVTFDQPMLEDAMNYINVSQNGDGIVTGRSLSEDGLTCTITANYTAGTKATLTVPTTVANAEGIGLAETYETTFLPKTLNTKVIVSKSNWSSANHYLYADLSSVEEGNIVNPFITCSYELDGKTFIVCLAGYDADGNIKSVELKERTASQQQTQGWMTAGEGTKGCYKLFIWDKNSGEPIWDVIK